MASKAKDMLGMMKSFFADWRRYRSELPKQDEWIGKAARKHDWSVNPRWMLYTNLKLWLIDSEKLFGRRYCPCFEPSGDAEFDRKLICPCSFAQAEIDEIGWCHCTLFGRADLTKADYKRAEERLMAEYRGVPLKFADGVLDTRGMPLDHLRNLPVPDALHQLKRALGAHGTPLEVIVATEVEAGHLERFAEHNAIPARRLEPLEDGAPRVRFG